MGWADSEGHPLSAVLQLCVALRFSGQAQFFGSGWVSGQTGVKRVRRSVKGCG